MESAAPLLQSEPRGEDRSHPRLGGLDRWRCTASAFPSLSSMKLSKGSKTTDFDLLVQWGRSLSGSCIFIWNYGGDTLARPRACPTVVTPATGKFLWVNRHPLIKKSSGSGAAR